MKKLPLRGPEANAPTQRGGAGAGTLASGSPGPVMAARTTWRVAAPNLRQMNAVSLPYCGIDECGGAAVHSHPNATATSNHSLRRADLLSVRSHPESVLQHAVG